MIMRAYPLKLLATLLLSLLPLIHAHATTNDEFDTGSTNPGPALPKSITLYQWPLDGKDAAAPVPLGQIGYNPRTREGKYFSLLGVDGSRDGLVRVGVKLEGGRGWVGGVVSGVSFIYLCGGGRERGCVFVANMRGGIIGCVK